MAAIVGDRQDGKSHIRTEQPLRRGPPAQDQLGDGDQQVDEQDDGAGGVQQERGRPCPGRRPRR